MLAYCTPSKRSTTWLCGEPFSSTEETASDPEAKGTSRVCPWVAAVTWKDSTPWLYATCDRPTASRSFHDSKSFWADQMGSAWSFADRSAASA